MSLDQWSPTTLYCYPVTMKLINCPCYHGADGLLKLTAVLGFVLAWHHNNVTLGISTVWRMMSFAVVQSPVADKDRVLTPFFANTCIEKSLIMEHQLYHIFCRSLQTLLSQNKKLRRCSGHEEEDDTPWASKQARQDSGFPVESLPLMAKPEEIIHKHKGSQWRPCQNWYTHQAFTGLRPSTCGLFQEIIQVVST